MDLSDKLQQDFHQHEDGFKQSITSEELNLLPLKTFEGKVSVITEADKLARVKAEIEKHEVVGFDTETRPSFKRGQVYKVALLQLAVPNKVFLIRLHHTGLPKEITSIFENEEIVKAGVAIHDDIKSLQRLNKFTPKSFVELATLARTSGLQVESVKKTCRTFTRNPNFKERANFELGSADLNGKANRLCSHRCMGVPGDLFKAGKSQESSTNLNRTTSIPWSINDQLQLVSTGWCEHPPFCNFIFL